MSTATVYKVASNVCYHHYSMRCPSVHTCVDRAPAFAARATLLSTEALKSKGMYTEAATLLIKMTSEVRVISVTSCHPVSALGV